MTRSMLRSDLLLLLLGFVACYWNLAGASLGPSSSQDVIDDRSGHHAILLDNLLPNLMGKDEGGSESGGTKGSHLTTTSDGVVTVTAPDQSSDLELFDSTREYSKVSDFEEDVRLTTDPGLYTSAETTPPGDEINERTNVLLVENAIGLVIDGNKMNTSGCEVYGSICSEVSSEDIASSVELITTTEKKDLAVPSRLNDRVASLDLWENAVVISSGSNNSFDILDSNDSSHEEPSESSQSDDEAVATTVQSVDQTTSLAETVTESVVNMSDERPGVTVKYESSLIINELSDKSKPISTTEKVWKLPPPITNNQIIVKIDDINDKNSPTPPDDSSTESTTEVFMESVTAVESENDYDIVIETLISTVTVDPVQKSISNLESTIQRFQRSIDPDLIHSDYDEENHLTTFINVEGRSANKLKKSSRRSDPEPDIDDIIQGIMQLLGGNVKIDSVSDTNTRLTTFGGGQPVSSTRTNDRGPPRLPLNPFNFFNGPPTRTRPPIRRPVTAHSGDKPVRGRPSFVANTLPPFFATLPPELDKPRPHISAQRPPTLTAYPLPVNLIPESSDAVVSPTPSLPASTSTAAIEVKPTPSESASVQSHSTNLVLEETTIRETTTTFPPTTESSAESDVPLPQVITTTDSSHEESVHATSEDTEHTTKNLPDLESSIEPSEVPSSQENTFSTTSVTAELSSSIIQTSTATSRVKHPIEPTSILAKETHPISSSPQSESSSVSAISITSTSVLEAPHYTSTTNVPLTTPEPPPTRPTRPINPHHTRTPPLRPLYPYNSSDNKVRPLPPHHRPRPGVVLDAGYHPGQVVTAPIVRGGSEHVGQVFDVTVSAHQGFGGPVQPVRPFQGPPYPIPQRDYDDFIGDVLPDDDDPVLVTPTGGTDGFVSIDGRKTYFDLFGGTATQPPPQQTIRPGVGPVVVPGIGPGPGMGPGPGLVPGPGLGPGVGTGVGMVIPEDELIDDAFSDDFPVGPPYSIPQQEATNRPPTQYPGYPQPQPYRPPSAPSLPPATPETPRPNKRRTTPPSIRIDTCIVGDDSTCQEQLQEVCRTEGDVSSCYCKPGTDRRRPRTICKKMVLLEVSIKVDRVGNQRISWNGNYANPESEEYQILEWESKKAIDAAFTKSALKSVYLGNSVQKFYTLGGNVIINSTVRLEDNPSTRQRGIRNSLQRHLIKVIQAHGNNIGNSALWVDGPVNPVPAVDDVNECSVVALNNCHEFAVCVNEFATFTCRCLPGYTDRYSNDPDRVGRSCETCSADYCHKRGECSIKGGHKTCKCKGSYYGQRCEVDGEVVAVAVGASAAAVVIIVLTLLFLCMWSRRWKNQDQKSEALRRGGFLARAAAGGHYLQQKFAMVGQPQPQQYGATMEDHIRWAQMNEAMAVQQNMFGSGVGPGGGFYPASNSQEYLAAGGMPMRGRPLRGQPPSVYSRVSRTLSNHVTGGSSVMSKLRKLFSRSSADAKKKTSGGGDLSAFIVTPNPNTMSLQQMMNLQAHLAANSSHEHGPGSPHLAPSNTQTLYKNHRQMSGGTGTDYGSMCAPSQYGGSQYGLQHLSPGLLQMPSMPPPHPGYSRAPSTYGQYPGPTSLSMSQSGLSRAPTLQLCDPGSSGGGSGLETSSEEEEPRRGPAGGGGGGGHCYQLPRPKSRASVGDSSDLYYELDDMNTTSPHLSNDFGHFNNINPRRANLAEGNTREHRQSLRHNPPYPSMPPPPLPRHIFNS